MLVILKKIYQFSVASGDRISVPAAGAGRAQTCPDCCSTGGENHISLGRGRVIGMIWKKYLNLRNILQYKAKLKLISCVCRF